MTVRRLALVFSAALIAATVSTAAAASESAAVMAAIHQFIDGFNTGNVTSALAACASPVSIVDEFPPHAWQGATACADWAKAYDAAAKAGGITDGLVTLGTPLHVDVSGDRAYAVVPAAYTYKEHGTPVSEKNSFFTVALKKSGGVWRITAWAWTKR